MSRFAQSLCGYNTRNNHVNDVGRWNAGSVICLYVKPRAGGGRDQLHGQWDVPALTQPATMACWATAATMLKSWRDNQSESIDSVLTAADQSSGGIFNFRKMLADNSGLTRERKPDFLSSLGLTSEAPQNFTVAGWTNLLKSKGPLWVTTNEGAGQDFAVHARVMIGISGDGNPDSTFVTFIDPADGTKKSETITNFTKKAGGHREIRSWR